MAAPALDDRQPRDRIVQLFNTSVAAKESPV